MKYTNNLTSVVVVILNWNKKDDVLKCLESVCKQDYAPFEVVVVENGSTDGSGEAIRKSYPQVHVVDNPKNPGIPSNRNVGFRYVEEKFNYRYILFLDNDTILDPSCLSAFVTAIESDPAVGIVTGKTYTEFPSQTIMSLGMSANLYTGSIHDIGNEQLDCGQFDEMRTVDGCGGFGFIVRKDVMIKINGFNEAFDPYGWEDVDLCLRAKEVGYKTIYAPKAIIFHKGTKSGRKPLPRYEKSKIKNYLLLLNRHTSWIQKISCLICVPIRYLILVCKLIFRGHGYVITSQFKGFVEGYRKIKQPEIKT